MKAPPFQSRPAARTAASCPRAATFEDWQTIRVSWMNPACDASWRTAGGMKPVRAPRVNASVHRVAIQHCGHAHALTPASPPMRPQLSRPAIAASSRPHQRSSLRCEAPLILPCAHSTGMQVLRRNVRAGDVSRMRILWRGDGGQLLVVRWSGFAPPSAIVPVTPEPVLKLRSP